MDKRLVIVNQATNYLTIGFCNAFKKEFNDITLVTGSIHEQGEELDKDINVRYINKFYSGNSKFKKVLSYLATTMRIYLILLFRYRKHDILFISLPPNAYLLNIFLPNKCSMIIWDVYPDLFKVLGMKETNLIYLLWSKLNVLSFNKAYKIFTIGNKMEYLLSKYVDKNKIIITKFSNRWRLRNINFSEDHIFKLNRTENKIQKEI